MSFAPVYNEHSRALILGTWPSPKSREMSFYYGHPQNRFWPMLAALTGEPVPARRTSKQKSRSSCATGWPCGIRWKAVPSPARRMRPSGTWCPMILPVCWQKRPLRLFFATGPRHIRSIQSISSRSAASRRSGCPAPAPPMPPAGRKNYGRSGRKNCRTGFCPECRADLPDMPPMRGAGAQAPERFDISISNL